MSFQAARRPGYRFARGSFAVSVVVLAMAGSIASAGAASLVSDKGDYAPGELATLTGSGFEPGEWVVLQVLHDDGTENTGENHGTWLVQADDADAAEPGSFVTTWTVCGDDCLGSTLQATAEGLNSGLTASVTFTDASQLGCNAGAGYTPNPNCPLPSDRSGACLWGCGRINSGTNTLQCESNQYYYASAGTQCRASTGQCDAAETCTGSSGSCPADAVAPDTATCTGASNGGPCDGTDHCSGTDTTCVDEYKSGDVCRAAANECDQQETCDGSSGSCPDDAFAASTTTCTGTSNGGPCDATDTCSGTSAECVDRYEPSTHVCRPDAGECDEAETCSGTSGSCPSDAKAECAVVTSSSLCPFDVDANACGGGDQFRLVFTPDVQLWPASKLSSSNPGQTYYNAVVTGTPGDEMPVEIEVPYPYVTMGGQALHVYDAEALTFASGPHGACFVPFGAIQSEGVDIVIEDYQPKCVSASCSNGLGACATDADCVQDGSGAYALKCVPPAGTCDGAGAGTPADLSAGYCTFTVDVTFPASGQVYLNLHLDHGLTGPHVDACSDGLADRYDSKPVSGGVDALENRDGADNGTGDLAIPNCQEYEFAHACPTATCFGSDVVSSVNEFKGIAGVLGQIMLADEAVSGQSLRLLNGKTVVATGTTDADGFYLLNYKHKGKAANFTVEIVGSGLKQVVTLKANGYVAVDWDLATALATVDYGSGWSPK